MTILCIATLPRTGSNHLVSLLRAVPQLDSRGELFHPDKAFSVRPEEVARLGRDAGMSFAGADDPRFVEHVRGRPRALLDLLEARARRRGRALSFKIFPPQLAPEHVQRDLVLRPGLQFILLRRRPIDSYISEAKAKLAGTYKRMSTSTLRVELRATEFLEWRRRAGRWYRGLAAALAAAGKRFGQLTYEDDIAPGPAQAVQAVVREAHRVGLQLSMPERFEGLGLERQDTSTSYEEKVSNWADFIAEIRACGSEAKLERYIGLTPRRR